MHNIYISLLSYALTVGAFVIVGSIVILSFKVAKRAFNKIVCGSCSVRHWKRQSEAQLRNVKYRQEILKAIDNNGKNGVKIKIMCPHCGSDLIREIERSPELNIGDDDDDDWGVKDI